MNKLFLLFGSILLFTSCLTYNRIQRNCPKFFQVCVTSQEKTVVTRDTAITVNKVIQVPLPHFKDSLRIRDSIQIITVFDTLTHTKQQYAFMDTISRQFGLIAANAWVNYSGLGIDAYLRDSSVLYNQTDTFRLKNAIQITNQKNTVPMRFIPTFYKFTNWFFWFFIAAVVLFLVTRIVKKITPLLK